MLINAERGAWSMLLIMLRPMSSTMVSPRLGAAGRAPRKREDGRCVMTIAGMRPRRRESEAENMLPKVERNLGRSVNVWIGGRPMVEPPGNSDKQEVVATR